MPFSIVKHKMSVMITECADQLVVKFQDIAKNEGKLDAKT